MSQTSGAWFNIKMLSYQYRKSHCGDKTVVRSSYLHNGISYTGKTLSLYWIRAQSTGICSCKVDLEQLVTLIKVKPWRYKRPWCETFNPMALKLEYFWQIGSIPWLLMTWRHKEPGHQQPWYWLYRLNKSLTFRRKNCRYQHHLSIKKLSSCATWT